LRPALDGRVVQAEVELLACEVECIPGRLSLARDLATGAGGDASDLARTRRLFERYAARVPRAPETLGLRLEAIYSQSAIRPGDRFGAAIAVHPCAGGATPGCDALRPPRDEPAFLPDRIDTLELERAVVQPHPTREGSHLVSFAGSAEPREPAGDQRLTGVLALRGPDGLAHVGVDLPLPRAPAGAPVTSLGQGWLDPTPSAASAPPAPGVPTLGLAHALLLAFLGGLVLNLMPCVLPVLAIKVVAVADLAQRRRREVVAHGLAYAAGILATLSLLATAVILLRAAGTRVGWGFQFQEPLFVGAISVVLVVFALNLFGVFEIRFQGGPLARLGQQATGVRRSLFEGLLAVVLATPCTAPFLGTAVGFAFAGSGAVILVVFLAIGLGLAAPFVLVTLAPATRRLVPRGGAWMLKLRAGLGFALLASVVWLVWIVGRTLGSDGAVALLALLLAVAFGAWLYGLAQGAARPTASACAAAGLLLVATAGLAALPREPVPPAQEAAAAGAQRERPFDPAAVSHELDAGRRVFVYFTADWCMTCKVNERRVIRDAEVRSELARLDVTVFVADWTRRDETIRSELARFGRAGVPLYLVYRPEAPAQPLLLPEILTAEALLTALTSS
jgi:thiol:disulfide interchange protein DsbD